MSETAAERAAQVFDGCHYRVIRNAGVCQECFEKALRAHANAALEQAAEILETQQVIYHSLAPHLRLEQNKQPDEVRKMYAYAIRALRDEG